MSTSYQDGPRDSGPAPGSVPGVKGRLKNIALFFAAPFITMYYLARLPFELPGIVKRLRDPSNVDGRLF
jgi:hypothetical protein